MSFRSGYVGLGAEDEREISNFCLGAASGRSRPPKSLKIDTFGDAKGVFKLNAKVTHSTVHLAVTEKKLNGAQVPSLSVYQGCLGAPKRMRAIAGWI